MINNNLNIAINKEDVSAKHSIKFWYFLLIFNLFESALI